MISSCLVELRLNNEVQARHLCSNVQSAIEISEHALDKKIADETYIFWMQAEDQKAAVNGAFVARSSALSYPGIRLVQAPKEFGGYRFTDEATRRRAAFAVEAGTDGARQERSIEPVFLTSEHITPPYADIPLEDQIWAKKEIEDRVAMRTPPRHPNPEIDFMMYLSHRTGTI